MVFYQTFNIVVDIIIYKKNKVNLLFTVNDDNKKFKKKYLNKKSLMIE